MELFPDGLRLGYHCLHNDLRKIEASDGTFRAIHRVCSHQHVGRVPLLQVFGKPLRNNHHTIHARLLHIAQRSVIRGCLAHEPKVAVGRNGVYQLLRACRVIVVDNGHSNVLHLHIHHPRHHAHQHDGKHQNQPRQKRIAPDLQPLFL